MLATRVDGDCSKREEMLGSEKVMKNFLVHIHALRNSPRTVC